MNKNEFMQQIERLRKNWGPSSYQGEILNIFWEAIGHIEARKFEKAVTRVIATHLNKNYPAGLDRIEMALGDIREASTASNVPSRFNTNAGYKKTENGVSEKQTNQKLGDILSGLLKS